ncbi:MAG: LacI family DNA-binding transcriptional regulator [Treponemataceae bacterium]|nr:MAG: LacI family DNA-binding transcriptional regulator [Treponemataceae bacterium]
MKSGVRMRDIAHALGVSAVTVSKALSGKDGVGKELRAQIEEKAAEMGYIYNSFPAAMLKGKTFTVGILIPSHFLGSVSFYWRFYQQLLSALKKTKYWALLEIVDSEDEAHERIPAFVGANKVDGIILLGQFSDAYLRMITSRTPNCVFLDFYSDIGVCDCIVQNNFSGSYNLTKLLIEAGHTKIGFVGLPTFTTSILDRYMGFCKAMLECGLRSRDAIDDRGETTGSTDFELELLPAEYTAYVCNNDQLAGTVIRQLGKLGLKVPDDISLVGFDNEGIDVTAGIGVTSLEVNITGMCETAVRLLLQKLDDDDYVSRGKSFIDCSIVHKQSIRRL